MQKQEMDRTLRALRPGRVAALHAVPLREFPLIPYERIAGGPQFVFSDHPEYIGVEEGAVLRETVEPGIVRLYTYHCNGVDGYISKITTVLENMGKSRMQWRFLRYGFAGPDTMYAAVAKSVLRQYFRSTPESQRRELGIGRGVALDDEAEGARVMFNELVHGFYEIEIDQPAGVTVLQTHPESESVEAARRLDLKDVLLPTTPAGAGRGLYRTSNYKIVPPAEFVLDPADGPRQLIVADGKIDPWIQGYDSSTRKPGVLEGNYGVIYDIELTYRTSGGQGWAVLTWNARSRDQWCEHMINVIGVNKGLFPGGFVEIPGDQVSLTGELDVSLIQLFGPIRNGETGTIRLTYTPPGASCLPTPILFIPVMLD